MQCRWQTQQEINTTSFIVERSADGITFTEIGTVPAAGYSAGIRQYSFMDMDPRSAINNQPATTKLFYRLKMLDKDGRYIYSPIANINLDSQGAFTVYPNPAKSNVVVSYTSTLATNSTLEVYNVIGYKILSTKMPMNGGSVSINSTSWPAGIYNVVLRNGDKIIGSKRINVIR